MARLWWNSSHRRCFESWFYKFYDKTVNIAHSRYQEASKESRKKRSEAEKGLAHMKIKELKAKKAKLNESVQHYLRQMDEEMNLLKRKLNDEWS